MISFVKGETEIFLDLPNTTGGLDLLLHVVQSFNLSLVSLSGECANTLDI
jgi:hypothetical protein